MWDCDVLQDRRLDVALVYVASFFVISFVVTVSDAAASSDGDRIGVPCQADQPRLERYQCVAAMSSQRRFLFGSSSSFHLNLGAVGQPLHPLQARPKFRREIIQIFFLVVVLVNRGGAIAVALTVVAFAAVATDVV